ncbi:MAG: ATP-binding protein [Lachnospiraceae bacterium]|jgi:hypothetical protein|nr:ATP-binding protein [Lachnospiraceae bacterium]
MGSFFNPGNEGYRQMLASSTYVDKSGVISLLNPRIGVTDSKYVCVSRARRFGKTWTADMLAAYYSRGCDSQALFGGQQIAKDPGFAAHLNAHDVVHLNIAYFYRLEKGNIEKALENLTEKVVSEIAAWYPDLIFGHKSELSASLMELSAHTKVQIVFIIDEWDHILRDTASPTAHKAYIEFLNQLLRDQAYVGLCYMTGILPIKKYKGQSSIGFFKEYSMLQPKQFAPFMGFTDTDVHALCDKHGKSYELMKSNYDGYRMGTEAAVYCPLSVASAIQEGDYAGYWGRTDTFESLSGLISRNFGGLRDDVVRLLSGERVAIDTFGYQNDLNDVANRDDVFTALAHMGYLGFSGTGESAGEVFIPNWEVAKQYQTAVSRIGTPRVSQLIAQSEKLLKATWEKDGGFVAAHLDEAHALETSVLRYHDENSLACTIDIAYYAAKEYYATFRELPTGKGFADVAFLPRGGYPGKPAMLVELKWHKKATSAIDQIKNKRYPQHIADLNPGETLLLVGINYDKKTKKHTCLIEELRT